MCGLSNWTLVDKDILDEENLEKHIAMRKDIGRMKTEIAEEWIIDRNPDASVTRLDVDVTTTEGKKSLAAAIESADAVLCCTDNKNSRLQVNRICLTHKTPCVTGLIYRTGFGGDCFLYEPGKSACYDCFLDQATEVSLRSHCHTLTEPIIRTDVISRLRPQVVRSPRQARLIPRRSDAAPGDDGAERARHSGPAYWSHESTGARAPVRRSIR